MLTLCSKRLKVLLICVVSVLGMHLLTFMILRHHAREPVVLRDELCKLSQTWQLSFVDKEPNHTDWSFNKRVQCPELNISNYPQTRKSIYLQCKSNSTIPRIAQKYSNGSSIFEVPFGDTCLIDAIDFCCNDTFKVQNIAHYVWYGSKPMTFFPFLSFMSAVRFIRPCLILIHGPSLPHGAYWDYFLRVFPNVIHVNRSLPTAVGGTPLAYPEHGSDVMRIEALQAYWDYFLRVFPNVIHVNRSLPTAVGGTPLAYPEHGSDVMRIEALQVYGGVYMDWDQVVLRSLDDLRNYDVTVGLEYEKFVACAFIMARRYAPFLSTWLQRYVTDYKKEWSYNCLKVPYLISQQQPEAVHIHGYNFTTPNFSEYNKISELNYDWSETYGLHFYARFYTGTYDHITMRQMNTTMGSIARYILFGNKELCF